MIAALASLRKGGVVAINAIHLDRILSSTTTAFVGRAPNPQRRQYDSSDARDFLKIAADIRLQPRVTVFSLEEANGALAAVKNDAINGAAVIVP